MARAFKSSSSCQRQGWGFRDFNCEGSGFGDLGCGQSSLPWPEPSNRQAPEAHFFGFRGETGGGGEAGGFEWKDPEGLAS